MTTVTQVLDIARGELGTRESPAGSNRTKYGEWYGWNGVPWCAIFVTHVLVHAGVTTYRFAAVVSSVADAKRRGRWTPTPRVGWVACKQYTATSGHTGIVEAVHGDGSITTIEGNTSGVSDANGGIVMRRRRSAAFWNAGYITVPYTSEAPAVPVYGADVSHHQGPSLDFDELKRSGVEFVWIKATEGGRFVDPAYRANRARARAAGIPSGAYDFVRPDVDPIVHARHFHSVAGAHIDGDLRPAPDIEVPGVTPAWLDAYRAELERLFGAVPCPYVATAIYQLVGIADALAGCPLWVPRYNTEPPVIPWDVWQYTDSRPAPGTTGIDGNVTSRLERVLLGATNEEDDMTPTQAKQLDEVHAATSRLADQLNRRLMRIVKAPDHPAVFVVTDSATERTWVRDGAWLVTLGDALGFDPHQVEVWDHAGILRIPLNGPEPEGFDPEGIAVRARRGPEPAWVAASAACSAPG